MAGQETKGDVIAQMRFWLGEISRDTIDTMGKPILPGDAEWMDANWDRIYPELADLYPPFAGSFSANKLRIVREISNVEAHKNACSAIIEEALGKEMRLRCLEMRCDAMSRKNDEMLAHKKK